MQCEELVMVALDELAKAINRIEYTLFEMKQKLEELEKKLDE